MSTKKQLLVLILLSLASAVSLAGQTGTISFNKYSDASCQDYAGTWVGFISEPNYAKAWPVFLTLTNQKNKICGKLNSTFKLHKSHKIIEFDCANGTLRHILWGEKGLGGYSQEGFLIDKDVMVLKLHYKTTKDDSYFIAFLNRKNEPVQVVFH